MCACYSKNFKLIKLLLENGVDVLRTDKFGCSAFHYACLLGRTRMCKVFLSMREDMDPNKSNESGYAPAHLACYNGCVRVVKCLLTAKDSSGIASVDFNLMDKMGMTPLMYACLNGHKDIVDMLLAEHLRCDVSLVDKEGNSLLHLIVAENNKHLISTILRANPVLINKTNHEQFTPLNIACARNHLQSAEKLIRCSADVNLANKEGETPLHFAVKNGNVELVALLLSSEKILLQLRTKLNLSVWDFAQALPKGQKCIIVSLLEEKTYSRPKLSSAISRLAPALSQSDVDDTVTALARNGIVDKRDLGLLSIDEFSDDFLMKSVGIADPKVRAVLRQIHSTASSAEGSPQSAIPRIQKVFSPKVNRLIAGSSSTQSRSRDKALDLQHPRDYEEVTKNATVHANLEITPRRTNALSATFDPLAASKRISSANKFSTNATRYSFLEGEGTPSVVSNKKLVEENDGEEDDEN